MRTPLHSRFLGVMETAEHFVRRRCEKRIKTSFTIIRMRLERCCLRNVFLFFIRFFLLTLFIFSYNENLSEPYEALFNLLLYENAT